MPSLRAEKIRTHANAVLLFSGMGPDLWARRRGVD